MVTYRGKLYDLAPLTREALSRPIENDIRYALQRMPESNEHLKLMTKNLDESRAHTILASIFMTGFLATRIIISDQKTKNEDSTKEYRILSAVTGAFFLSSTFFSWRANRAAKNELIKAVEAFNEVSPQKIVPASSKTDTLEPAEF